MYRLLPLTSCRREHHCAIMYRLSKLQNNLDHYRPTVKLRSRKKGKIPAPKGKLEKHREKPNEQGEKVVGYDTSSSSMSINQSKVQGGYQIYPTIMDEMTAGL